MGKWREICRDLSLGGFLSYLVTNFQTALSSAGFTGE